MCAAQRRGSLPDTKVSRRNRYHLFIFSVVTVCFSLLLCLYLSLTDLILGGPLTLISCLGFEF